MSFRWFIALFITALIWTMGVLAIIQYSVFGNTEDVVSMIIVYVSVKFLIFIITKVVIDAKT
jgi:hypothetical protein